MRKVAVIVGPGRSGTSLVMHILHALGMAVSDNMVEPRYHNPLGPMEDKEVAKVFDQIILPACKMNRLLPLSPGRSDIDEDGFKKGIRRLEVILKDHLNRSSDAKVWGFKDPVVSNFLEHLFPVFNRLQVVPKFVLCVRNPASVVNSRKSNFKTDPVLAELSWLTNTLSVLKDTGADCFIVHYEDLVESNNSSLLLELANYVDLDESNAEKALSVVQSRLDRQTLPEYEIKNQSVKRLYEHLKGCRGTTFDRGGLLSLMRECEKEAFGYQGWLNYAYQATALKQDVADLKVRIDDYEKVAYELKVAQRETEAAKLQNRKLSKELACIGCSVDHYGTL